MGTILRIAFSIVLGAMGITSTVAAVGASEVGQAVSGAPLLVREGAQYGLNVGVRLAGDHGHGALERHLMGALVDKLGEHASREIGALYRGKALENAGLQPSGEGEGLSTGEGAAKGVVEGGTEGIGYLEHKILHALSGAAQGALLDLKNPAQSALWGAIGAAGAEVAMEAVYDPVARSKALIKDINQRVAQGELKEMLADVGVELPQGGRAGEAGQRQGVVTRSQSRKQQAKDTVVSNPELPAPLEPLARPHPLGSRNPVLSGTLTPAHHKQLMEGLTQIFTKELRADVERTRDLVRAGFSLGALASGVQSEQMSMMDGTASQALTHNAIPLVAYVGGAALEAALPGLLASAAGALGITYAWDALTDLFSGSTEQQLPFGNEDEKLRLKGKPSDKPTSEEKSSNKNLSKGQKKGSKDPQKDPEKDPRFIPFVPLPKKYNQKPKNTDFYRDPQNSFKKIDRSKFADDLNKSKLKKNAQKSKEEFNNLIKKNEKEAQGWVKKYSDLPPDTAKLLGRSQQKMSNIKRNCGARAGKPNDATTLNAAKIEKEGGQIELAKERGIEIDHVQKVKQDQEGLRNVMDDLKRKLSYPKLKLEEFGPVSKTLTKVKKFLKHTEKFVPNE